MFFIYVLILLHISYFVNIFFEKNQNICINSRDFKCQTDFSQKSGITPVYKKRAPSLGRPT